MKIRRFTVKALSVGALNNKIFHSGNEVTSKHFPKENIDKLIKDGFLEEIEPTEEDLESEKSNEDSATPPADDKEKDFVTIKSIEEISEPEMREYLTEKKVFFRKKAEKLELYGIWLKAIKEETGE